MATRPRRRPDWEELDPGAPLYVRRGSLEVAGRIYSAGDEFPCGDPSLPARRARQLYDQRYLVMAEDRLSPVWAVQPRVVRRGETGWYDVLAPDGTPLNPQALRLAEAEALARG